MKKALIISTVCRQFYLFETGNIQVLKKLGYEVHCAANFDDANERLESLEIVRHYFDIKRSPFSIKNIKAYKQLRKIIDVLKPELIHCHSPMGGVLGRLAARNARKSGTKVIYTAHGFHFFKGAHIINWILYYPIEKILSIITDAIITLNKEDYDLAVKSLRSKKTYYVPGIGVDTRKIENIDVNIKEKRNGLGIPEDAIVLISIGEFIKRKNHETLLKSFSKIRDFNNLYLLLCGRGELEIYLKELCLKLGIEDKVIFSGYRNDIYEILKISDIFVFPSFQEGLPVSVMEAMASKLPVICSKIRGNTDLIVENEGGYLLNPSDAEGFAKAISILCQNRDKRLNIGQNNLKVIKNFDSENVKKIMEKIYTEILDLR